MKSCVLDASVVATAFFQEEHADAARALLVSRDMLYAPDLIRVEFANVIWKRHGRGEIDEEEANQLLSDLLSLPLRITASDVLIDSALKLALGTGRTVYDCLYLALAIKTKAMMFSSDRRLVNALAHGPLSKHIAWIGTAG